MTESHSSIFESFVRVVQPWVFAMHYPRLKVRIEPQTKLVFEQLKSTPMIICPNHCRHEDGELLFLVSILVQQRFSFLAAREMFSAYFGIAKIVLRELGCFAVDRGGENQDVIRAFEHQLTSGGGKVVIFPEGEIGYDNDHVEALEPGAVAIGLETYVRLQHYHQQSPVCIMPLAISYQFDDAQKVCEQILNRLEEKLSLPPLLASPFVRAKRASEAFLSLREKSLGVTAAANDGIDDRVSRVFLLSLQRLAKLLDYKLPDETERHQLHHLQSRIFAKGRKASLFHKSEYKRLENETLKLNRVRSVKAEKFEETSSLHSLADLLCNLDYLITSRQSFVAPQTVVLAAAEPLQVGKFVEQFRKEREPTIEHVNELLLQSLQEQLQKMRATHDLSDLGGNNLTLRKSI